MIIQSLRIDKVLRSDNRFDRDAPERFTCAYVLSVETEGEPYQTAVYADVEMTPAIAAKIMRSFAKELERLGLPKAA